MPRQARLDAPGTLHHVFIRGIERKEIVKDDWQDRDYVLKWFGGGLILSQGGWSAVKALKSGSRSRKITIVRSQLACVQ
jgi:hypothetical protein